MTTVGFLVVIIAFVFFLISIFYNRELHESLKPEDTERALLNIAALLKGGTLINLFGFLPFYVVKVLNFLIGCGILYIGFYVL